MDASVEDLLRQADILSSRATALFAERDTIRQQATQARAYLDYQRTQLQSEIDQLKTEADALASEFKRCYQAAAAAYDAGDGALAKGFSLQGHAAQAQCEALNAQWMSLTTTLTTQRNTVDTLFEAAKTKHQEALACVQEAKQLRAQAHERQHQHRQSHIPLSDAAQRGAAFLADGRCHVIKRHVEKTGTDLKQRLAQEPHLAATSSFTNLVLAAEVVGIAIERNRAYIHRWLATSQAPRLVLEYEGRKPIGYVVPRAHQILYPTTRALIILKRDSTDPLGYYVVTAYPVL